jgi:hypothetical protein
MHLADRCFPALRGKPRFVETLLVPFHCRGRPAPHGSSPIASIGNSTPRMNGSFARSPHSLQRDGSSGSHIPHWSETSPSVPGYWRKQISRCSRKSKNANASKLNSDEVKPIWRKGSDSATPGAGAGTLFRASSMVGGTLPHLWPGRGNRQSRVSCINAMDPPGGPILCSASLREGDPRTRRLRVGLSNRACLGKTHRDE